MIIKNELVVTETSEALKSQNFGIRAQDMSFVLDILRKKMYKNPINAVCREIASNSRDAHREVNTPDVPIEITLPTKISPQIEFKDYGPGINPKRMWDIFLNYGASTKRDSNKYLGGFGLGAKVPLSLSDTFSVITIYGGKKRHYTAIIDETRLGRMDLLLEEDTDEHTGTTIIIPAKEQDFTAFAQEVVTATKHWSVKRNTGARPKVFNLPSSVRYPDDKKPLLEGDDWELFDLRSSDYYDNSRFSIVIDGIGYTVDLNSLDIQRYNPKTNWIEVLLSKNINLHFPIGKLSLASNRDNIHFDEPTKKAIIEKLAAVNKAIKQHAFDKIKTLASLEEAEIFWNDFCQAMPSMSDKTKPVWNNIELRGIERRAGTNDKINITRISKEKHRVVNKRTQTRAIHIGDTIVVQDQPDSTWGLFAKINRMMEETGKNCVFLVEFLDDATLKRWNDEENFNILTVRTASSLPAVPRKPRSGDGSRTVRNDFDAWVFNEKHRGVKEHESYWESTKIEKDNGTGIYIEAVKKIECNFKTKIKHETYSHLIAKIKVAANFLGTEIHCVRSRDISNLGDGWRNLDDVIEEELKLKFALLDVKRIVSIAKSAKFATNHRIWDNHYISHYISKEKLLKKLPTDSLVYKYLQECESVTKEHKANEENEVLLENFGYLLDKSISDAEISDLEKMSETVKKKYPLMVCLDRYSKNTNLSDIVDYIVLIDERDSKKEIQAVA